MHFREGSPNYSAVLRYWSHFCVALWSYEFCGLGRSNLSDPVSNGNAALQKCAQPISSSFLSNGVENVWWKHLASQTKQHRARETACGTSATPGTYRCATQSRSQNAER